MLYAVEDEVGTEPSSVYRMVVPAVVTERARSKGAVKVRLATENCTASEMACPFAAPGVGFAK